MGRPDKPVKPVAPAASVTPTAGATPVIAKVVKDGKDGKALIFTLFSKRWSLYYVDNCNCLSIASYLFRKLTIIL